MRNNILFFLGIFVLLCLAAFLPGHLLPADILQNFPSFRQGSGEMPKNSLLADPVFQFEPWRIYMKEQFVQGMVPFINARSGAGSPFLANPQTAMFYPLTLLYYLLSVKTALYAIAFLKLYFFGIFWYLYFRSLSFSRITSCIGAAALTFSGFFMVWLQWPHTNVLVLFPLLLFITEKIRLQSAFQHRWYILLAVSYFVAILGGHPETLFKVIIIHSAYSMFRLWYLKRALVMVLWSIGCGFLLGSFVLFPFFEYLLQSYTLQKRSVDESLFYLPIKSIISNVVPFILGAPHLSFYKPFAPFTNFQEQIGGYIGTALWLLGIVGLYRERKHALIRFWAIIAFCTYALSYNIFPFSLLSFLPVFNVSVNQRFIFFGSVGLVIGALFVIEKYVVAKKSCVVLPLWFLITILSVGTIGIYLIPFLVPLTDQKTIAFTLFLQKHLFFLFITTLVFFLVLTNSFLARSPQLRKIFLLSVVLLQTVFLFWNYNPVITQEAYYPKPPFLKTLAQLPQGRILEVGNPILPPNSNLAYQLETIENDDALEIRTVRNAFDMAFPIKNHWGNVDEITDDAARKFGIKYILSDYDVTLEKLKIQPDLSKRLEPLMKNEYYLTVQGMGSIVKGIRILPANFNRRNTCLVVVTITEKETKKEVAKQHVSCLLLPDTMFYTVPFAPVLLNRENHYQITFSSVHTDGSNHIALWGNEKKEPYGMLLIKPDVENIQYTKRFVDEGVFIYEVKESLLINYPYTHTLLKEMPTAITITTQGKKDAVLEVKRAYFNGWVSFIDGIYAPIQTNGPFMAVTVPKGTHTVAFQYVPLTFFVGLGVSFLTTLGLLLALFKHEQVIIRYGMAVWKHHAAFIVRRTRWWYHSVVLFFGFIIGVGIFMSFLTFVPLQFAPQETSAINWLTIHRYPKQQDYFYFFLGNGMVFLIMMSVWSIWIWTKIKK